MKTDLKNRIEAVLRNDLHTDELVRLHNQYCEDNNYYDDYIDRMSDIDDLYSGLKPSEILDRFEGVNTNDEYYIMGIYGAQSFDYYGQSPVTLYEEIAQYCADNEDSMDCSEIQECIDEWYEENEELEEEPEYVSKEEAAWDNGGEDSYMEHYFETKYGKED